MSKTACTHKKRTFGVQFYVPILMKSCQQGFHGVLPRNSGLSVIIAERTFFPLQHTIYKARPGSPPRICCLIEEPVRSLGLLVLSCVGHTYWASSTAPSGASEGLVQSTQTCYMGRVSYDIRQTAARVQ